MFEPYRIMIGGKILFTKYLMQLHSHLSLMLNPKYIYVSWSMRLVIILGFIINFNILLKNQFAFSLFFILHFIRWFLIGDLPEPQKKEKGRNHGEKTHGHIETQVSLWGNRMWRKDKEHSISLLYRQLYNV